MEINCINFPVSVQLSEDTSCGIGTIVDESALQDECDLTGTVCVKKNELGWDPDFWPRVIVVEPWGMRLSATCCYTDGNQQIKEMRFISGLGHSILLIPSWPNRWS